MAEKLDTEEINKKLENLDIWGYEAGKLVTRVEFDDYKETVFFANSVFSVSEEYFHHPTVLVEYGAVEIDLWTHDAEGITEKDFELARAIEEKVRQIQWG